MTGGAEVGGAEVGARYVFLFAPNNSGKTIVSQHLAQQLDGYLPPWGNHEGQGVPALRAMMRRDRWNPLKPIDWPVVDAEWDRLRREAGKAVFVEASPPNLMRVDAMRAHFGAGQPCLFLISNPILYIASCIYNYRPPPLDAAEIMPVARGWARKASALRQAIAANSDIPLITYEAFCRDPFVANRALGLAARKGGALRGKATTGETTPRDMTAQTAAFLSEDEIAASFEALAAHGDTLAFFGYDAHSLAALQARTDADARARGEARRAAWEREGGSPATLRRLRRRRAHAAPE